MRIRPLDPNQKPAPGSLEALMAEVMDALIKQPPAQRRESVKRIYEGLTGQPYVPPLPDIPDDNEEE
jgi:hypothetical protein